MNTNTLQTLLSTLKSSSDRVNYVTANPMNAHREDFLKHRKELLALVLKEDNPLPLCMRFCWAQSFLQDAPSETFVVNRIVLSGLFTLAEIGIPFQETPDLNRAILDVLQEYATSEIEDPKMLSHYPKFLLLAKETRTQYLNDPRFRDIFASANSGNYS